MGKVCSLFTSTFSNWYAAHPVRGIARSPHDKFLRVPYTELYATLYNTRNLDYTCRIIENVYTKYEGRVKSHHSTSSTEKEAVEEVRRGPGNCDRPRHSESTSSYVLSYVPSRDIVPSRESTGLLDAGGALATGGAPLRNLAEALGTGAETLSIL